MPDFNINNFNWTNKIINRFKQTEKQINKDTTEIQATKYGIPCIEKPEVQTKYGIACDNITITPNPDDSIKIVDRQDRFSHIKRFLRLSFGFRQDKE